MDRCEGFHACIYGCIGLPPEIIAMNKTQMLTKFGALGCMSSAHGV